MLGNTPKLQSCRCHFYDLGSHMLGGTWGALGGTGCSTTYPLLRTSHLLVP